MSKILIVEPDESSANRLARGLSRSGYQVETVSVGEVAVRRIQAQQVDVLITEVNLPDMQACDLIARVHRIDPEIPVLVTTDDESWETSRKIRIGSAPVFYYGLKPLDPREMQQVVHSAIQWRKGKKSG